MLEITIKGSEMYNEITNEFSRTPDVKLQLEHSLLSLTKWESKWHKPFLSNKINKTDAEIIDYIKLMTITKNVDSSVYERLSNENIEEIHKYIDDPMTATTISRSGEGKKSNDVITSEIIYYWMFSLGIPKECEKWHINRLLMQIEVGSIKNAPPKKKNRRDFLNSHYSTNKLRREQMAAKRGLQS